MDGYWWKIIHNERLQDYPRGTIGAPKKITSKTQRPGESKDEIYWSFVMEAQ